MFCIVKNCNLKKCVDNDAFCKKHCGDISHSHCENTRCFRLKQNNCCYYHCTDRNHLHCEKALCSQIKCKNNMKTCKMHCVKKKCKNHCSVKNCNNKKERNNLCLNCFGFIFGCLKCGEHKVFISGLCVVCHFEL